MARKHRNASVTPREDSPQEYAAIPASLLIRWVSPYLSVEDQKWLQDHSNERGRYMDELAGTLEPGFSFGVKYDFRSERYLATIVCTNANHDAGGCGISVRGSTASNAQFALAYLVLSYDDAAWWVSAGNASGSDFG